MLDLPQSLAYALSQKLGVKIQGVKRLSGGMVNTAARVQTTQGPVLLKWKADAPAGFFEKEALGLQTLAKANVLRVPQVLAFQDRNELQEDGAPISPYLALEFIEERPSTSATLFKKGFAEGLAGLHQNNPSPSGRFGLEYDNFLGAQTQINTPHAGWPAFYRDCRLTPQIKKAKTKGLLPQSRERLLMLLLDKVEAIFGARAPAPLLIHGDLWSGNFLTVGDEAALIDPAIYYADREVEMAYVELFGGFPQEFIGAYNAAYPLEPGYEYRRPLHQLYPLLVHLVHFGEEYGPAVVNSCRFYLR